MSPYAPSFLNWLVLTAVCVACGSSGPSDPPWQWQGESHAGDVGLLPHDARVGHDAASDLNFPDSTSGKQEVTDGLLASEDTGATSSDISAIHIDAFADHTDSTSPDASDPSDVVTQDSGPVDAGSLSDASPPAPVDPLLEWIGSPCASDSGCPYTDGYCLQELEGFPGGHCSQACSKYCPDLAGAPTTFCVALPWVDAEAHCVAKCDFALYPAGGGCRDGYVCAQRPRFGDPSTQDLVCLPEDQAEPEPCIDPTNFAGDDACYLELISFGSPDLADLAQALLEGSANAADALDFLDLNYALSQTFITSQLGVTTIHPNHSWGHSAASPMTGMIVHYTAAQREEGTIKYFVSSDPHASTHFVIGSYRNGLLVQLFSHEHRTWHAGSAYNIDRFGVDFANAGYLDPAGEDTWESYNDTPYALHLPLHGAQPVYVPDGIPGASGKYASKDWWQPYSYYQVLTYVLVGRALDRVYTLDPAAIERHGDVSSSRVDPGPALPKTYADTLIFNDDDVWSTEWLNAYKLEPKWITDHPEAR